MKLAGTYTFEAPTQVVWDALFDPDVLAATLPGCEGLVRDGDEFTGDINVKMGPVQGRFKGKVNVTDQNPIESYTMVVDGRGPAGLVKATAKIALSELAATRTELAYEADVSVGGRMASVGQRLLDASSRAIVKQSLEGLNQQITALALQAQAGNGAAASGSASEGGPADAGSVPASEPDGAPSPVSPPQAAGLGGAQPTGSDPARSEKPSAAAGAGKPAAPPQVSQAAFMVGVAKEMGKELLPARTLATVGLIALLLVVLLFLLR